jgi:hypothetical protein
MFFKTSQRVNPATGQPSIYYRLVESSRNVLGTTYHRHILTAGFMDDIVPEELWAIADGLNDKLSGNTRLFSENPKIQNYIDNLWSRLVSEKKLDIVRNIRMKASESDWQQIDINSIKNEDIRELGSEWMCLQTLRNLHIDQYLLSRGWAIDDVNVALAYIVSHTVYPDSELKTVNFMQENSSICELLDVDPQSINNDKLHRISQKLYGERQGLENHLSVRTNELFDIDDKIILYDLTNAYFEGSMRKDTIAHHGRSTEKHSDCPLVVLALVVNEEGFIKYSEIYEGNMADCNILEDMIDKLQISTGKHGKKAIVVIDAGISTEANLDMITEKGYDYVCINRSNLKKYSVVADVLPIKVIDNRKREIELIQVQTENSKNNEYYLRVNSPTKALMEVSMYNQFVKCFEEGLALIRKGIETKGGVKRYDKVNQRLGRLKQQYPSVYKMYDVHIQKDKNDVCTSMTWQIIPKAVPDSENIYDVYFLRSSITGKKEDVIWKIYNCVKESENSFRTLRNDLDLRQVFHKTDDVCMAHLHLGLMSYWLVNTIRHQLKAAGCKSQWREIVRVMNTQKCVTTTMTNDKQEQIAIRCCSKPTIKVANIYDILKLKHEPFTRKKSVILKSENLKNRTIETLNNTS